MHIAELTLHEPTRLSDAFRLLVELGPEARLLAGGTDLLTDLKTGRIRADHLISLHRIGSLVGIRTGDSKDAALWIGAATTLGCIERAPLLAGPFVVIRETARVMASLQIRNAATLGGNIAGGVPCADMPPVLGVLDAAAVLASREGTRRVPLRAFYTGPRTTVRGDGEILTAIEIPHPPPGFGAAYARLALRDGNAIAVASAAASLHLHAGGRIAGVRLILGAVAPIPRPVPGVENILVGQLLDETLLKLCGDLARAAAEPISDIRGSDAYRRDMVGVLASRAMAFAHARALEAAS